LKLEIGIKIKLGNRLETGNLGGSWIGDSRFFERVKTVFNNTTVMDRLKDRPDSDPWQTLKEAINKARTMNGV